MTSKAIDRARPSAAEIDEMLRSFAASAQVFSSDRKSLIDKFENKWVAVYRERVEAVADSLDDVMRQIAAKGIPAGEAAIRFVDRGERTLIL